MSEPLTATLMLLMYGMGFTTAAALFRDTPFWRGWRRGMTFGVWNGCTLGCPNPGRCTLPCGRKDAPNA